MIEEAINLLNELHKERLSYDEYAILIETIQMLQKENELLTARLKVIKEAVDGENRIREQNTEKMSTDN